MCIQNDRTIGADFEKIRNFEIGQRTETPCGICEQPGAEVVWYSPNGRGAHKTCYDSIDKCASQLYACIDQLFDKRNQNDAQVVAIEAIKNVCKISLKDYLTTVGEDGLKELINAVAIPAVKKYAEEIAAHKASRL